VTILDGMPAVHVAHCSDGRKVQIRATMKKTLTFPARNVPDFYLGIQICPDGTFTEVFNGPGSIAQQAIASRKPPSGSLHSVSVSALAKLSLTVLDEQRIPLRARRIVVPS